ncbi:MAG: glycerol-3-phosphate dehydrogenase/oxidase, partial [Nocardioidaceae bacterium]
MDDTVALNAAHRRDSLRSMTEQRLDILVVGGGIVGAGCALDAATRGLRVGLVEAGDIAAGTSSRSSKLIHGGLRYLEMLQFRLVGEALKERGLLLHDLAPHLVRPVPFLYPLKHRGWERLYAGAGVALYDALARAAGRSRRLPSHRHLSRARALKLAPSLRRDSLVGALQYYDAQVDDARFTMFVARTAATHGAAIATRTRATSLLREGGRVTGAIVQDRLTGKLHTIHARHVVLATGVWSGDLLSSGPAPDAVQVRASKGIHLVVPGTAIQSDTGLILRTEHSVLFVIPWGENWIIGTTDTDWTGDRAHPAAQAGDISYLLATINSVLCEPVTTDDIIGVYTGLRPLVAGKAEHTAKLSREHVVV